MAGFAGLTGGTMGKLGAPKLPAPKPLTATSGTRSVAGPPGTGGFRLAGAPPYTAPKPSIPTNSPIQFSNPFQTTPRVPQVSPQTAASTVGGGASPAPLDATALANIAAYINKTNNSMAGLGVTQAADQGRYQSSYDALKQQNPLADLKLMTGANDRGGLYSSAYGQQLGNLNQQYQTKEGDLYSGLQGQLQAIASRMAGYQSSIPAYESQQATASAQRLAALAANAPGPPAPLPASVLPPNNPPVMPGGSNAVLQAAAQMPSVGTTTRTVAAPVGVGGFRIAGAPPGATAPSFVPSRALAPKAAPKKTAKAAPKPPPGFRYAS